MICGAIQHLATYLVGLFVNRLHHHHVPSLINPVDSGLQLDPVTQFLGHALTDLTGASLKLPLLQQ